MSKPPAWWRILRGVLVAAGIALAPVFFMVMFHTVTALVRPSFGSWAWSVPVATEGCFALVYGLDILLEAVRKPNPRLRPVPYLFAAGSLVLNVYAGWGNLADALGHAMVTLAFFVPVIAGKSSVRSLSRTEEEVRLTRALSDARRYAIDYCRAFRGPLWRWRIPSLVRTQITRSRLPDEVRQSVVMRASMGGWQKDVRDWLMRELQLGTQAEADAAAAATAIAAPPQDASENAPEAGAGVAAQAAARPSRSAVSRRAAKPPVGAVKRMTPGDLAPYVGTLLESSPGLTPSDLMKSLHIGREKATEALRLARRERLQTVVR